MALSTDQEMMLHEYQIAGEMCRNHDALIRTGITIFGAAQAAILAFIASRTDAELTELLMLEGLGFWLSIVVLATTFRLGHRYRTHMERARQLEEKLGFDLFNYSQRDFESKWYLNRLPGNKRALISLPTLLAITYGWLLIRDGWPQLAKVFCQGASP